MPTDQIVLTKRTSVAALTNIIAETDLNIAKLNDALVCQRRVKRDCARALKEVKRDHKSRKFTFTRKKGKRA